MYVIEGFLVGLVGSLHCAGMCGPLALAIPVSRNNKIQKVIGSLIYNVGRAVTYAIIGIILGGIGEGIKIAGMQQWVSIVCGALMIMSVLLAGIFNMKASLQKLSFPKFSFLQKGISRRLKDPGTGTLFIIGLLNGLLPCGLVYIAVSGALLTNSVLDSALYMFLFGLGTLPMMFAIVYFGNLIKGLWLGKVRKLIPVFIVILGLLFIVRGLNLGIPYLSPKFNKEKQEMKCCH